MASPSSHRRIVPSEPGSKRPQLNRDSSQETSETLSGSSAGGTHYGHTGSGETALFDSGKKRRAPGTVAIIACAQCRKARQKESLLKEIANLRRDNTRLQTINEQVSSDAADLQQQHQGLQDSHNWQQIVLDEIGRNGHDREIIRKLRAGETSEAIARWLCEQEPISHNMHIIPPDERSLLDIVSAFEHHYRRQDGLGHGKDSDTFRYKWTQVTSSRTLLGHLFDLYFTWVHPVHMLFSELAFKESFRTNDSTYCSPALVNAICAMACHLVDKGDLEGDIDDVSTLGNGFMNQARREVLPQNYTQMTSVQALAVMYLSDLSAGKARSAIGYLRASAEFLKAAEVDGQSAEAREITLWGIQTLNTSSTGITYQKLYAPEIPPMIRFEHVDMYGDDDIWRFYRTDGDPGDVPVRPSHTIMTASHQAGLFRIIHESLNLYCGLRGLVTAESALMLYRRYTDWAEDLPLPLTQVEFEERPLPHVLFLQYSCLALGNVLFPLTHEQCPISCGGCSTLDTFDA
ncbi:MAG: hypothetical protein Q9183_003180 [Haloplaca sp. 2 TL-2023]